MRKYTVLAALLLIASACSSNVETTAPVVTTSVVTTIAAVPTTTAAPAMTVAPTAAVPTTTVAPAMTVAPTTTRAPTTTQAPATTTAPRLAYNPDDYFEISFEGAGYLCQETWDFQEHECARYVGGSPPSFYSPDLYCSGNPGWLTCTKYDPDKYFEITLGLATYLCQDTWSYQQYDCVTYRGGQPPSFILMDLYCSGNKSWPDCSSDWYPDELDDYTFVTIGGSPHLCQRAFLGGWGDYDCARYNGGNPARVSFGILALKCTESGLAMECATDYYPSEWEGLELMRIDFSDYVCRSTWQGNECHRWYGSGSPKSATYGLPDYYCNSWGDCARNGYP